jgi:hypothetical protein
MATIVTNANWLQIDGARLQKGKWDLTLTGAGVRLSDAGQSINIPYQGTTIDGSPVSDAEELFAFFESQGFKPGGSGPGPEPGDAVWGGITGTLSAQTDLQNALNGKQNLIPEPTNGRLVSVDGTGQVQDSGYTASSFATAEQGTLASTAVQPAGLPTWSTISGKPAFVAEGSNASAARTALGLGTAATAASTDFATAAQGGKADTATQPADIANRVVGPSSAANNNVPVFDGTTGKLLADSGIVLTALVRTSDDQTVGGVKTFSSIPVLPGSDPTTSNQAVRKAYADSLVAAKSNKVVEIVGASDASLTYGLTHAGLDKIVRTTGGGNKTHTVPAQATVSWPDGAVIQLATPSSEVTIEAAEGVNIIADQDAPWVIAPNTLATLARLGSNEWILAAKFKEE